MPLRHRQHRVAIVPLDDRPCNTKFPESLGRIVEYDVLLPPRDVLGRFRRPGQPEAILSWVQQVAGDVDCVVVSLDMVAYGGLIASRTMGCSADEAMVRLSALRDVRKRHPDLAIYGSSVILRLSVTADSDASAETWAQVARYSELAGRELTAEESAELETIEAQIPPEVLADYLAARERNHAVNQCAIELVADGTLDFLSLLQEDAAPTGPHVAEQEALRRLIAEREAGDRCLLYPGADEAVMTLLARFVHTHMLRAPRVAVVYADDDQADAVAMFEDRPLRETVAAHIAAIGAEEAVGPADADLALFVSPPVRVTRRELVDDQELYLQRCSELEEFVEGISSQLEQERAVVVCDVAFPNGADPVLAQLLLDNVPIHRLASYAAWNTAGNSLGSGLAHGSVRLIGLQDKGAFDLAHHLGHMGTMRYLALLDSLIGSEKTHVQFLFSRFIDDWAYQAEVRRRATEHVAEQLRQSAFDLAEGAQEAEEFVRSQLTPIAHELYLSHFLGRRSVRLGSGTGAAHLMLCELDEVKFSLPWGRLFEVDVAVDFDVQLVAEAEPASPERAIAGTERA